MSGERQSRWQRAKNPKPILLQPRDKGIVTKIHEFGFLSRDQIQRLFSFNCTTRVNIRLRKLFDHGYLSRRFLHTSKGSSKAIYFLGPEGIHLVSVENGIDPLAIEKRLEVFREKKELFFDHDILVNEVRIAFYLVFNNGDGLRLDRWVDSTDCLQEYRVFNKKLDRGSNHVFRPDGYFRYFYGGKIFSCFLEVDRSTMSNTRFQSKVKVYLDYAQSGLYQQRYGLKFFRVLVLTKTKERLLNLKSVTEELTDKIFWFSTVDDFLSGKAFARIWERPHREGYFSLLE